MEANNMLQVDRLETKELVLLDHSGKTRIRLSLNEKDAPQIELFTDKGATFMHVYQCGDGSGALRIRGELCAEDEKGCTRVSLHSDAGDDTWFNGKKLNGGGGLMIQDEEEEIIFEVHEDDRGCATMFMVGLPPEKRS